MKKALVPLMLLTSGTISLGAEDPNSNARPQQLQNEETRNWTKQQIKDWKEQQLERLVQLPSAADINAKLKTALGEKYNGYIEHNRELCDNLANKTLPAHSIGSIIAITIFHYQEDERSEVQSTVLTALVKDNPHALAHLQKTNYITTKN